MLEQDLFLLADKAEKFLAQFDGPDWHTPGDLYDDCLNWEECEFVAACSPERVLAAMDVIRVARALIKSAAAETWMVLSDVLEEWDKHA